MRSLNAFYQYATSNHILTYWIVKRQISRRSFLHYSDLVVQQNGGTYTYTGGYEWYTQYEREII